MLNLLAIAQSVSNPAARRVLQPHKFLPFLASLLSNLWGATVYGAKAVFAP